ncbi:DUF5590 domain-containing protein [Paenibacillus sp. SI8]|uniref:cell wall elongation regulator TseB-like domain-containing protein n=1 Tax=unclassified Paenibacillus TaxID=185978 RepID=UPI003467CCD6
MNWKRTVALSVFILLTLGVVLSRFYLDVQNEHWDENSKAVEIAYEKSILTKASRVESFYGDDPFKIIYGEDKVGQSVLVWVYGNDVHTEMTDDAFTEAQVRELMLKKGLDYQVQRVLPGKLGNVYVWEVFYKKQDETGTRYFYDYYNFKDGTYMDTYRLSLQ